ncbi:sugar ABC transporter substrate-binding protein [Microbacterium sp.]|uniref:sugar ABC transporter substrate-binding protein n=1 Tax=Microbacterium sp. TaxID=51671 RepID=UPI0037C53A3E
MITRRLRPVVGIVAAAALAVALVSCSGDGGTSPTEPGADPNTEVDAAGIATAQAELDKYRQPPTWQGPSEPVSTEGLEGKRVTYINVSSGIPVLKYWADELKAILADQAGVILEEVDAKGSVDEANRGFQHAIASGSDVVVLVALFPELFQQQFAEAQAAGIKVITAQSGVPGNVSAGQDAEVSFDYVKVGELIADWFIVDSEGTGKATLISSDDVPASQPQVQATLDRVAELCPTCDVKVEDIQIPQWETSVATLVQSTINTDPERTYFLPLYDGQGLSGIGAIRAAGAGDRVTMGAFNATPGIVEMLLDPTSGLGLDMGGHNEWWAYAMADQIFRVLTDTPPIENYNVGLRIFDRDNAGELIVGDDEFAWYEFDGYKDEFLALWGN